MGKFKVGSFALLLAVAIFGMLGCFGSNGDSSVVSQASSVTSEPLTNVRFEIQVPEADRGIRAQAAVPPTVYFELRLLDRANIVYPVVRMVKRGQVIASGTTYTASAMFANVPVLPAIASMSINGGYLVGAGSQQYKIWVGKKDLVAASENVIALVGSGDKSATDVSVNLLDKLIAAPANVATLATPIFTTVDQIVASLTLSLSTVYDDAYKAYIAAYGSIPVPADAEFPLPTGYASLAYPKKDSSVSLLMPAFKVASESWVLLMNRGTGFLSPSWSVPKAGVSSVRASVSGSAVSDEPDARLPSSEELNFHLRLRNFKKPLPVADFAPAIVRPSIRAVAVNDEITFNAYVTGSSAISTVRGRCRLIFDHGTGRSTFLFLDVDDIAMSGVDTILNGVLSAWSSSGGIYSTDRGVFGEEPPGTFNSSNPDDYNASGDLYVLVSRKIYTAGYFWAGDLYPASVQTGSNYKKIFYLQLHSDISDITRTVNDLASTMAHEFQHMIHFWQKRKLPQADAWLEEAMSGYAEYINGYRIENQKNQSKALQANAYFERVNSIRVDKWHLDTDISQVMSAHYGKAFLFGVWLAQNYGNSGSVQNLLSVQLTEKPAVEAFTGETFDKTFAKFMLAMAVNDSSGGIYGFKGLDLTTTYSFGTGWAPVTLTGPAKSLVDVSAASGGATPAISPYAAAYVKIINGNGSNVTINATLPAGISLFQLQR